MAILSTSCSNKFGDLFSIVFNPEICSLAMLIMLKLVLDRENICWTAIDQFFGSVVRVEVIELPRLPREKSAPGFNHV